MRIRMTGLLWPGLLQLQSMSLASSRPERTWALDDAARSRPVPMTGSPQLVRALALHGVFRLWGKPLGVTP
ncbi:hypothetical protein DC74_884 [Streptomyces noursei]|uniref:Uncharacterized protein n=1 Tax=Streptomyces noursei TaxID=1971 RepID=A0A059W0N2_STRNR|nr:hypothetical protein DC74_884 [Streptomyces noursei]GCB89016.1 hypothetical protein SALB_01689 [Streptomyces noursei]